MCIFLLQINLRKHISNLAHLDCIHTVPLHEYSHISYSKPIPPQCLKPFLQHLCASSQDQRQAEQLRSAQIPQTKGIKGWEQTGQRCVTLHQPSSKANANRASCVSWPCGPWYNMRTRNGRFLSAANVFSNEGVSLGLGVAKENVQTYSINTILQDIRISLRIFNSRAPWGVPACAYSKTAFFDSMKNEQNTKTYHKKTNQKRRKQSTLRNNINT